MAKITEKHIKNYLSKLIDLEQDNAMSNQSIIDEILQEHLSYIPNCKLYKYRECNENNMAALSDNKIWMASAKDFKDIADFTLNYDLTKNLPQIEKWADENIVEFLHYAIKCFFKEKGGKCPFSYEEINYIKENFYDKNGKIKKDEVSLYLAEKGTPEDIEKFFMQYDLLYERIGTQEDNIKNIIDVFINSLQATNIKIRNDYKAYSMAKSYNVNSLWENYASNYTGYCIEYDFRKCRELGFEDYKSLLFLLPIIYKKKKPIFDVTPFIDIAMRQHFYGEKEALMPKELQLAINMQLLYKSADYSYEQEWRLIGDKRRGNLQLFPFVSAIYIGKDIAPKNENKIKAIALELGVPVLKQQLNSFSNRLEYISTI